MVANQENKLSQKILDLGEILLLNQQYLADIRWELQQQRRYNEIIKTALAKPTLDSMRTFMEDRQLGFRETLETIARNKMSFARFGDGELKMMLRSDYKLKFQNNSPNLRRGLNAALSETDSIENLLVGLPHPYTDLHWTAVWLDIWPEIESLIRPERTFGNSHVSRPIFFEQMGDEGVKLWRNIWENKNVCIVTGLESRFKKLPELFDNVASWQQIYTTPINAFNELDQIVDKVMAHSDSSLFLIALGPAGTILTHRIAALGHRAIDIGHISDSYENVFEGGAWPESKSVTSKM